ncbi:MAG: hypothetical protein A2Y12_09740 [Planctomycetes bacterium GWF2_42_9]|nr:MAG: hypothetical protein A2Y12_09740 [Planctomycetes bacterium GWF2_42_9]
MRLLNDTQGFNKAPYPLIMRFFRWRGYLLMADVIFTTVNNSDTVVVASIRSCRREIISSLKHAQWAKFRYPNLMITYIVGRSFA